MSDTAAVSDTAEAPDAVPGQDTAAVPDTAAPQDTPAAGDTPAPDEDAPAPQDGATDTAADVGGPATPTDHPTIATGTDHACALAAGGAAWCWGQSGPFGKLGDGGTQDSNVPVAVSGGKQYVGIWAGGMSSCALTAAGEAWCWGAGFGTSPTAVPGYQFKDLTLGTTQFCGVTTAGELICNVVSQYKKMADGQFDRVSCGNDHCCAIDTARAAWCWALSVSANKAGELGTNDTTAHLEPTAVVGGLLFASISAATNYTCALDPDSNCYCWGQGGGGTGGVTGSSPQQTKGIHVFSSISTGTSHACGIAPDGSTLCWGSDNFGQVGNGGANYNGYVDKTAITGGSTFVAVAAGKTFTCGVADDGKAYCWGANSSGKLGVGTADATLGAPTPVAGTTTWMVP